MNEVIKLAIEKGGYREEHYKNVNIDFIMENIQWRFIVLDPLFWQALNKALDLDTKFREVTSASGNKNLLMIGWMDFAHHYFHLVLTGGDTEKFWNELISQS